MSDIKNKVIEIVKDFLLTGEPVETASMADDLAISTPEFIEMTDVVKSTFKIEIKDEDIGDLVTVGDLINFVEKSTS